MQVMELKPDTSVSLVDTDMEADVTPSQEFLDKVAAEHRAAQAAAAAQAEVERAEEARQRAAQQVRAHGLQRKDMLTERQCTVHQRYWNTGSSVCLTAGARARTAHIVTGGRASGGGARRGGSTARRTAGAFARTAFARTARVVTGVPICYRRFFQRRDLIKSTQL